MEVLGVTVRYPSPKRPVVYIVRMTGTQAQHQLASYCEINSPSLDFMEGIYEQAGYFKSWLTTVTVEKVAFRIADYSPHSRLKQTTRQRIMLEGALAVTGRSANIDVVLLTGKDCGAQQNIPKLGAEQIARTAVNTVSKKKVCYADAAMAAISVLPER